MTEPEQSEASTRAEVEASAMRFLGRRDHARGELEQKLLKRDFPDHLIEAVLDEFADHGYLDDRRFALEQGSILARKCWGPHQIAKKLRARGVDKAIIDEALAEIGDDDDWKQRAVQRLHARFGEAESLDDADMKRAFRHLRYRGYAPHMIRRILFD